MRAIDFSDWVDVVASPAQRLPSDITAAVAYVAEALGHVVYRRWTLAAIKASYPSFGEATNARPAVMALLRNHREVVEYWHVGRVLVVTPTDAPKPEAVLEELLARQPKRFKRTEGAQLAVTVNTGAKARAVELAPTVLPARVEDWLARSGRFVNADHETNTLGATNDAHAVALFLHEKASRSKHTHRAYVAELRRLAIWCQANQLGPFSALTRHDLLAYRHALSTGTGAPVGGSPNKPSDAVKTRAIAVVTSLFGYWAKTGYLSANPAASLDAGQGSRARFEPRRVLRRELLEECDAWVRNPLTERGDDLTRARQQAIWTLYRYAGVRLVELVWSDEEKLPKLEIVDDGRWKLTVLGKRRKIRAIPLPKRCIMVLQRYRRLRGLPPDPPAHEHAALIHGLKDGSLRTSGLYDEVKAIFQAAAELRAKTDAEGAKRLREASPHWLRHGYARELVVEHNVPLPVAQALLGHASIQTTAGYTKTDFIEQGQFVDQTFPEP